MSSLQRKIGPLTLDVPALVIGVQILLKGWEKAEDFAHHPFLASLLLGLGAAATVAAFLTIWLERKTGGAHGVFHLAEGAAISLSALALLSGGKVRIPLLLLLAGLCYLTLGSVELQPPDRRARLGVGLKRGFGWTFVSAGVILAVFTAAQDRSAMAFATSAILTAVGAALLIVPLPAALGAGHPPGSAA